MRAPTLTICILLAGFGAAAQAPKILTPEDLFRRDLGTREQQAKQFPPHRIAGNVY